MSTAAVEPDLAQAVQSAVPEASQLDNAINAAVAWLIALWS